MQILDDITSKSEFTEKEALEMGEAMKRDLGLKYNKAMKKSMAVETHSRYQYPARRIDKELDYKINRANESFGSNLKDQRLTHR